MCGMLSSFFGVYTVITWLYQNMFISKFSVQSQTPLSNLPTLRPWKNYIYFKLSLQSHTHLFSLPPPSLEKPLDPCQMYYGLFSTLIFFSSYQWQFFIGLFLYGCLHIILLLFCEGGSIKWQNFLLLRFKSSAHFCHSYHILHLYQNQS